MGVGEGIGRFLWGEYWPLGSQLWVLLSFMCLCFLSLLCCVFPVTVLVLEEISWAPFWVINIILQGRFYHMESERSDFWEWSGTEWRDE